MCVSIHSTPIKNPLVTSRFFSKKLPYPPMILATSNCRVVNVYHVGLLALDHGLFVAFMKHRSGPAIVSSLSHMLRIMFLQLSVVKARLSRLFIILTFKNLCVSCVVKMDPISGIFSAVNTVRYVFHAVDRNLVAYVNLLFLRLVALIIICVYLILILLTNVYGAFVKVFRFTGLLNSNHYGRMVLARLVS